MKKRTKENRRNSAGPRGLLRSAVTTLVWGISGSLQQLECKLRGCRPVQQFAFLRTTCTVCTTLTTFIRGK